MTLDDAEATGPTWERAGNRFLLRIPNIARFLLEDGRSIAFEADEAAEPRDVAVFLSGSVFGILLHQRNQIVLHSSAVLVGGKAVLFCGVSGAGKSTLAAALGERGYPLIADDQCAIDIGDDGVPRIQADGRQLRLWERSIVGLGLEGRRGESMRNRLRKFYVDPAGANATRVTVGAIYALAAVHEPEQPGIDRPNVVDATRLLMSNAYRPMLVRRLGQQDVYFQGGTTIAAAAGIFRFKRAWGFDRVDDTVAMLEAHWASIGLTDTAS
jgi:hypothetical protein